MNNAGHGDYALIKDMSEDQFDRLVNVHFRGVFFLIQALLPLIADGGRIVVVTVYMAKELGSRGIAVNAVAPGAVETDFGGGRLRDNPDVRKIVANMTALGRTALPDDIGPMIASLLSDDNKRINGQRIEVSGGMGI